MEDITHRKIVNRILRNSELYSPEELFEKSVEELLELQTKALIHFRIKIAYQRRRYYHNNQTS